MCYIVFQVSKDSAKDFFVFSIVDWLFVVKFEVCCIDFKVSRISIEGRLMELLNFICGVIVQVGSEKKTPYKT